MARTSSGNGAAAVAVGEIPSTGTVPRVLALCALLPALGTSIANVALPTFTEAFGASFRQVQWVVLAYLLANTTLVVGAGRLGDLAGRRRLLLAGLLVFTVSSALCGAAPSLSLLIAARALQGMGAAVLMALSMAMVSDALPKSQAGWAMGLLGTASALGTALGPPLGGVLIATLGWPAVFFVKVPLGLLALGLAWRYLPRDHRTTGVAQTGFDATGTVLLALTLAAYALAMTTGHDHFRLLNLALLLSAMAGLALFLRVQARAASPLIRLARLRDPVLSAGFAMSLLVSTVVMATLVVGPFHLERALGLETVRVGLALAVGPVVAALAGVPAGRLVGRYGARRMTVAALTGMTAACLALCVVPGAWGVAGYVLPVALLTAHYALFQAANNTSVMADVAADQRGVVSGLLNLSRNLGLITGTAVMGNVFAWASGTGDFTAAAPGSVAHGMRWTFAVTAGLMVVALGVARKSCQDQRVRKPALS
jgi:EmrB/QacA subfamily drug resistance transporter